VNAIRDDDDDQILPLSACYVKEFKNEIKVLLSIHLEKKFSFKKNEKDASRRLHTHFDVFFIYCLDIRRPFFFRMCSFPSLLLSHLLNLSVFLFLFVSFLLYPPAYHRVLSFFPCYLSLFFSSFTFHY